MHAHDVFMINRCYYCILCYTMLYYVIQLKVDAHTMNVPTEAAEAVGDDKNLLSIKQAIHLEVDKQLKDLEERVAAIEKKLLNK